MRGSRATASARCVDARADQGRHREHELLRHDRARPLRADALRAPARRRAAVLPQPDGAPREGRRRGAGARTRPHRRAVLDAVRQAREPRRPHRRRRAPRADRRRLRGRRRGAREAAPRRAELPRPPRQPARPGMVAPGGARRAAVPRRGAERRCSPRSSRFQSGSEPHAAADGRDPRRPLPRQRAVRRRPRRRHHRFRLRRDGFPRLRPRDRRERLVQPARRRARSVERTRAFVEGYEASPAARRRTSARNGRRCCAPPRCASGSRASTTSTCRGRASSSHAHDPAVYERILAHRDRRPCPSCPRARAA